MLFYQLFYLGHSVVEPLETRLLHAVLTLYPQKYGVFLAHFLSENLFPHATALDFAFIGGFNFFIAMLVASLVTITARPFGIHIPMLLGITFLSAGHVAASVSSRVWQLYLSIGVLIGLAVDFTYIPSTANLSQCFEKRRSLANGRY